MLLKMVLLANLCESTCLRLNVYGMQEKFQYLSIELWLALKNQETQLIKKVNSILFQLLQAFNGKQLENA